MSSFLAAAYTPAARCRSWSASWSGPRRPAARGGGNTPLCLARRPVGRTQPVLIENREKGHTDNFAPLFIADSKRGDTGAARIIGRNDDQLVGTFV